MAQRAVRRVPPAPSSLDLALAQPADLARGYLLLSVSIIIHGRPIIDGHVLFIFDSFFSDSGVDINLIALPSLSQMVFLPLSSFLSPSSSIGLGLSLLRPKDKRERFVQFVSFDSGAFLTRG